MKARIAWIVAAVSYFCVVLAIQAWKPDLVQAAARTTSTASIDPLYAVIYLGLGMVLLGAIAHVLAKSNANLWRTVMLCVGAALALMQVWVAAFTAGTAMSAAMWMSALLGLALAAVITRILPERIWLRWYGMTA